MLRFKLWWVKYKLFQLKYFNFYDRLMTILFGPVEHIPTTMSSIHSCVVEEQVINYYLAMWVTGRKRLYRLGINYPSSNGVYYPKDNAFLTDNILEPEEIIKKYILLMKQLDVSVKQLNHLIVDTNNRSPIFKA
ncbi:hypothetical protein [Aeromonas phage ZPAH34]|uniref:hypothetical protein n=1 Tax=Aeromonas phage ZPAH34 TaxID=2924888 RepID=UPI00232984A3|nr:hypothetical protein PQD16_gp150 [Aeromonas phage ZPAH34]UOX39533.1 hypothetical protein [Aeromonas phage ZPAH34]